MLLDHFFFYIGLGEDGLYIFGHQLAINYNKGLYIGQKDVPVVDMELKGLSMIYYVILPINTFLFNVNTNQQLAKLGICRTKMV